MAGRWLYSTLLTGLLTACSALQPGDLLFHVTPQDNAITAVTPGMTDHVAIVLCRDSVIEAVPRQGVRVAPLDSLCTQPGYYVRARVRGADRRQSLSRARQYLGRAYDHLFLEGNEEIYCSELVLLSFVDKHGNRLLHPVPMSFHDASGRVTPYWTAFYARHGMAVPEGQPGSNPGELMQRKEIKKLKK